MAEVELLVALSAHTVCTCTLIHSAGPFIGSARHKEVVIYPDMLGLVHMAGELSHCFALCTEPEVRMMPFNCFS